MGNTPADVLKMIKDNEVEWVDVRFTDPKGAWHHLTMCSAVVGEDERTGQSPDHRKARRAADSAGLGLRRTRRAVRIARTQRYRAGIDGQRCRHGTLRAAPPGTVRGSRASDGCHQHCRKELRGA